MERENALDHDTADDSGCEQVSGRMGELVVSRKRQLDSYSKPLGKQTKPIISFLVISERNIKVRTNLDSHDTDGPDDRAD